MLIGRYPALLDANVLHPAFVRAALLWFADEGLFQPCWSPDVLREWRQSLKERFADLTDGQLDQKLAEMAEAFPAALVTGYEPIIPGLTLPDPDDRHVLAAAIVGKCSGIVTSNLKDFPTDYAAAFAIEIIHPDDFIVNVIDLDPGRALEACKRHRTNMVVTTPTPEEFLAMYEKQGLVQAHGRLAANVGLL